jgi:hypothetical protein
MITGGWIYSAPKPIGWPGEEKREPSSSACCSEGVGGEREIGARFIRGVGWRGRVRSSISGKAGRP